jgi:hypothetical protein
MLQVMIFDQFLIVKPIGLINMLWGPQPLKLCGFLYPKKGR